MRPYICDRYVCLYYLPFQSTQSQSNTHTYIKVGALSKQAVINAFTLKQLYLLCALQQRSVRFVHSLVAFVLTCYSKFVFAIFICFISLFYVRAHMCMIGVYFRYNFCAHLSPTVLCACIYIYKGGPGNV